MYSRDALNHIFWAASHQGLGKFQTKFIIMILFISTNDIYILENYANMWWTVLADITQS